jgi:YVTN family beta-propeller protein
VALAILLPASGSTQAAEAKSQHVVVNSLPIEDVRWTEGFWANRFAVNRDRSIPAMWEIMRGTEYKPFLVHFMIAAGDVEGGYHGAQWTLQGSPSHGIGVAPDGKTLWVCSKVNHAVYAYAMPGLELVGGVEVGHHPDWLTFTPDIKSVYVANAGSNSVSVVDIELMKEVARIPVGQIPKRNVTATIVDQLAR